MKYLDGRDVKIGDRVRLGHDELGLVVCSIDSGEYTDSHPEEQWSYLEGGVMIEFPTYGLIHFIEPDEDLELIERAKGNSMESAE